jgi:hypothetical protein
MRSKNFALCLNNRGYPASLEIGKIYRVIKDKIAEREGYLRIVDESGEDYAFTSDRFHLVELPAKVEKALRTNGDATALAK